MSKVFTALKNNELYIWVGVFLATQFFFLFNYTINGFFFDDAFITYRYAYNLETHNFFTYNLDDAVYGTTTPLYAFLIFALVSVLNFFSLNINYHILSQILSILFFTSLMVFLYHKFNLKGMLFFILFIFVFFNAVNGQVLYSGMETFFITFLLISFLYYIDSKNIYFILPFLVVGRFDISLIALLTFISFHVLRKVWDKDSSEKLILKIAKIVGVFLISLIPGYLIFGEIIPNTILAKSVIYTDSVFEHPLIDRVNRLIRMGFPIIISSFILLVNIFFLGLKIKNRDNRFIQFDIFFWGYFLFLLLFVTNLNQWYFPPLNITAAIIFILNISRLKSIINHVMIKRMVFAALILAAAYTIYADQKIFIDKKNDIYSTGLYKISSRIEPNSKVFCGDIGIVGFFSQAYIYDYAGLVTPAAIDYNRDKILYEEANGKSTDYKSIIAQIKKINPDYIIFRKIYPFYEPVLNDPFISENYYMEYNGEYDVLLKKNEYVIAD